MSKLPRAGLYEKVTVPPRKQFPGRFHPRAVCPGRVDARVARIARWAATRSPFYRKAFARAGLRPEQVQGGADLARLPILTRDDLRERMDEVVAEGTDPSRCPTRETSGTRGEPLRLASSRAEVLLESWLWARLYRRYGLRWWHRQAKLARSFSRRPPLWVHRAFLYPRLYLPVASPPSRRIEWIESVRPHALFGYASVLYEVALELERVGRRLNIPLLFSTSDQLAPNMRALIQDRLGRRVRDMYGAVETGPLAGECERGQGYHLLPETNWVEVLDEEGRPARCGRLVCTVLWRRTTPLLRYDLGDWVEWTDEPCPCGIPGPRLLTLHGRQTDLVRLPDGGWISGAAFTALLVGIPGIRQFQVVERPGGAIEYRIVPGPGFAPEEVPQLESVFRERFGDHLRPAVVLVDHIPAIPGRKRKVFLSAAEQGGGQVSVSDLP